MAALARIANALVLSATLLGLAACGTVSTRSEQARKPGGYYLDDGPGENPPADLDRIPDAQPRVELIKASTARPYTVFGQTYVPMTQVAAYKQRGMASWYGKRYHGQPTSSGELYDMYAMTAAHPTLPIPSYARITNLRNTKSVVVRINDRGPFHSNRVIDLSYAAAYKLGIVASGRDLVEVEAIVPGEEKVTTMAAPVDIAQGDATDAALADEPPGSYVQLGAFATRQNAQNFLTRMRTELSWLSDSIAIYGREGLYRVHAGPYAGQDEATRVAERLEQSTAIRPVIITR